MAKTKRAKTLKGLKLKIIWMFKQGHDMSSIKSSATEDFPKITLARIRTIIKRHLEKRADGLWSAVITQGGRCEVSGKTDSLQAHHLIHRANRLFRWNISNGISLNMYYHSLGNDIAAHGATDVTARFAEWMETHRPGQWQWFLENKDKNEPIKHTIEDVLNICTELEGMLKTKI